MVISMSKAEEAIKLRLFVQENTQVVSVVCSPPGYAAPIWEALSKVFQLAPEL